jgi:DNA repair exonuclease SbcCD nuclease subunit
MILLYGDLHDNAEGELFYVTKPYLERKYGEDIYNSITALIILGDCWITKRLNNKCIRKLSKHPFPTVMLQGNHEDYNWINAHKSILEPILEINSFGIKVTPKIYYLPKVCTFTIKDKRFLSVGGGLSLDKYDRVEGESWWKDEYLTTEEKELCLELISENKSFDYVLSHVAPIGIVHKVIKNKNVIYDDVSNFLQWVDHEITFKEWYFGHYHVNYDDEFHCCLYKRTILLE